MNYIGIDNGLNGGISILNDKQEIIKSIVMPVFKIKGKTEFDIFSIVNFFRELNPKECFAILEKGAPRSISGKRACFMTGGGYYLMQGILASFSIPYEIITPQRWQKEMFNGLKYNDTKQASIMFCQRRFPGFDLTATKRSKKPHDGKTDSIVMALYGHGLRYGLKKGTIKWK